MEETLLKLLEHSVIAGLFAFAIWTFGKVLMYVGKRLVSNDDRKPGLLTEYLAAHKEFLAGLAKRDEDRDKREERQIANCEAHAAILAGVQTEMRTANETNACTAHCLKNLIDWAGQRDAPFSTWHFNETMVGLAKAELLRLSITESMPLEEQAKVRFEVEALFKEIRDRHQEMVDRLKTNGHSPPTGDCLRTSAPAQSPPQANGG